MKILMLFCIATAMILTTCALSRTAAEACSEDPADDLLARAELALQQRKFREAVDLATKVVDQKADYAKAYVIRGIGQRGLTRWDAAVSDFTKAIELMPQVADSYMHRALCFSELDEHAKAIADFDQVLRIDSKARGVLRQRGREYFKAGNVANSLTDFDLFAKRAPEHELELWERGLSRYYAGEFAKAQKSFEDYHKVGPSDIENGLWRLLSQAEIVGLPAAQKDLFAYEPKLRPPFPALYELYTGKVGPDEVIQSAAAGAENAADRRTRTFYAHLYVGLWYSVNHDKPKAIEQLEKATALRSTDYMWYVGRFHLERLKAKE